MIKTDLLAALGQHGPRHYLQNNSFILSIT